MTIKFKSILMGIATTSAILGGLAFQNSSAQAISLKSGDTLNLTGNLQVRRTSANTFDLLFNSPSVQRVDASSTTPFVDNDRVTMSNLINVVLGQNIGAVPNFISDIALADSSGTDTATFSILEAILTRRRVDAGMGRFTTAFTLSLDGLFNSTNEKQGIGNLTFQFAGNGPAIGQSRRTSLSSSLAVVPTPAAVLPALIGMGTAALRKKKREGEEELVAVGVEEV